MPARRGCGGFFFHFIECSGFLHFFRFVDAALSLNIVELFDGFVEAVSQAGLVEADVLDGFRILLVVPGFDEGVIGWFLKRERRSKWRIRPKCIFRARTA